MTDFIHEHPKDKPANSAPPPAQEEPTLDEKTGQKRVYGYIFILFIVAFSLLLWSYMMNQRGTDQVLSELRGNADALQTTLTRNVELEQQVDELQAALRSLEAELKELQARAKTLESENAALTEERDALQTALDEAQAAPETDEEPAA